MFCSDQKIMIFQMMPCDHSLRIKGFFKMCFHIVLCNYTSKHKLADALLQQGPNYLHFQARMINGPCHNLFSHFFIRLGDDERPSALLLHPPLWSRPLGPPVPAVVPRALPNNWLLAQPRALISAGSCSHRQPGQRGQHSGSWLVTHGPAWVGVGDVCPSHKT